MPIGPRRQGYSVTPRECEARTYPLQSPPLASACTPQVRQPRFPTDLAWAEGKRQGPEAVVVSSFRACVTARGILATAGHPGDALAQS